MVFSQVFLQLSSKSKTEYVFIFRITGFYRISQHPTEKAIKSFRICSLTKPT